MKMTPEQKAFYEYGRATEELHFVIYNIRNQAHKVFGEKYGRLIRNERKYLIEEAFFAEYVENVRQKRAACRKYTPEYIPEEKRSCVNCWHNNNGYRFSTCPQGCLPSNMIRWEHLKARKEENE